MSVNRLGALGRFGQSVWFDYVKRSHLASGGLAMLIAEGVTGVTSNPAIFEQAIAGSDDYDSAIASLLAARDHAPVELYEALAVDDIQRAADVLLPVYRASHGADGYVSLEVAPHLAKDTAATVAEAVQLWQRVGRANLMVKVPATAAGLVAVRALIGQGINVNVTLLFDRTAYRAVADAYLSGLEDLVRVGGDVTRMASVASFFVSRVDTALDAEIERRLASGERSEIGALRGKIAIAHARLAYRDYLDIVGGARWAALARLGARPQRLLWASTGTKNKAYSDVRYVEELIGPDTVNTMPPATLDAFRDHGEARASLVSGIAGAAGIIAAAEQAGLDLPGTAQRLLTEGLQQFLDAADRLMATIARKRETILAGHLNRQTTILSAEGRRALEQARRGAVLRRVWSRDASLWSGGDEAQWLGWLEAVTRSRAALPELEAFQASVNASGVTTVLLLGMGGSSLGPEVIARVCGSAEGYPSLVVLDSTDPDQIAAVQKRIDLARTLVIVSSKSGSTLESNLLLAHFRPLIDQALGRSAPDRIIVVTDPGSSLDDLAQRDGFQVFHGSPDIGGRYSVLSPFGLVPAAAIGIDCAAFLDQAALLVNASGAEVPPADCAAFVLGTVMAEAYRAGRDKLTLITSPGLAAFGAWVEQLIAESTGKGGIGIIPIDREPLARAEAYGPDRLFLALSLSGDAGFPAELLDRLESAGHPVVRIAVTSPTAIAQEFFRFELATAVAGAELGINPFDQPDVEATKRRTRELTKAVERDGALPGEQPLTVDGDLICFADPALPGGSSLDAVLEAHLRRVQKGDYLAILACMEQAAPVDAVIQRLRAVLSGQLGLATTAGFGPRYLHSTGQVHKGGAANGLFLMITAEPTAEIAIDGKGYGFGTVASAQARGDFDVLVERRRRVLRIHLGHDRDAGLARLEAATMHALSRLRA